MKGGSIPYHLRVNKAIERQLFLELLLRIHQDRSISECRYVGFGGHSLDDFKLMHSFFGIDDMVSIESCEDVYRRQRFNRPLKCIDCRHGSSESILSSFDVDENDKKIIFWLDHTSAQSIRNQLEEFSGLLARLDEGNIVKITVNADLRALESCNHREPADECRKKRFEKLKSRLDDLLPARVDDSWMSRTEYPKILQDALRIAAERAFRSAPDLKFQPLTSFVYADGQQMYTLTGIVLKTDSADEFLEKTGIKGWEFGKVMWESPTRIDVPDMTMREKLFIDRRLPGASAAEIARRLCFNFTEDADLSLTMLESYIELYRHYPQFSKISV